MQDEKTTPASVEEFRPVLCDMETICAACPQCKSIPVQGNYGYCVVQDKVINHETDAQ